MNVVAVFWLPVVVGALGALMDIRTRRLPNLLCAVLACAGLVALALHGGTIAVASALLHAAIALCVGLLLFRLRMVGGGDVKFYVASACAIPLAEAPMLLLWTSVSGFLLVILMLLKRFVAGKVLSLGYWNVPYGVAIAAGLALSLFLKSEGLMGLSSGLR
ncbi:Flp pilus assembly protein protease [Caenibius tardaugens NBRC 16725]|uniref:Flp pilus assembly protein protease n=1 Tax=Caenibius tardaugens NBRC 16725 TaxID=1219035 RepID=U2YAN9_9SPHN|nr:prepilin peptidase [Caenibius tardaugens]AZI35418.1 hypothetical protein EGO55_05130 [Caenibius tardaugens NBRC 16725]GAD50491.1 Flp pilus assembly protein protease [Caenibius tardaugens NBRC 16725]